MESGYRPPENYLPRLDVLQTEAAVKFIKDTFERELARELHLMRVSAPLFVRPESGLNDDLSGEERPVQFDVPKLSSDVQIVHSLAKWKRVALKKYGFRPGTGLYTDMNAIRRDESLDPLHSIYVDQWDWEKVILHEDRTTEMLAASARGVYSALKITEGMLCARYSELSPALPEGLAFVSSGELKERYPDLTPKERENAAAKEFGAVFLSQIGGALSDGKPHDSRAPDYDDWSLNGDILVWYPLLNQAVELSSMGIRVDPPTLVKQLRLAACPERESLPFHRSLLAGLLPQSIGGGIGQSRICMVLLQKAHIGEVQASVWPSEMIGECEARGIHLL